MAAKLLSFLSSFNLYVFSQSFSFDDLQTDIKFISHHFQKTYFAKSLSICQHLFMIFRWMDIIMFSVCQRSEYMLWWEYYLNAIQHWLQDWVAGSALQSPPCLSAPPPPPLLSLQPLVCDCSSGKLDFYFLVLLALFLLATSKKSSFRKSADYLSQDIPFTFYDFFSTFQYFFTISQETSQNFVLFLYFFELFCAFWPNLLWKSEVLFYFFYKKAPKSKNQVFLMLSGGPIIW